jgi:hypothetical protein
MPVYNLEFQIFINVPAEVAYDHLNDPHHYVGLQPLLTHVDKVKFGKQDGLKTVSYETVEAFRWKGIVLYRNRIRVQTVFTLPPKKLNTVVHSFPNITLNVEYTFTPKDNGVLINETVQIHTAAWLAKFVTGEATRVQNKILENLKNRLEA